MATLTESELKEKLKTAFTDNSISGDLVDMMSTFAARFLYLEQYITAGIVMEGSFSRCVKLNSRITHAADNFYSVQRGNCRKVQLQGVTVLESISATKYDVINTYGDYKLVYASDYALAASNTPTTIDCLVTLGMTEVELQGNGLLYLDVGGANISEDIIVYNKSNSLKKYDVIRDISKLSEDPDEFTVVALTQPNYSVRLWRNTPFRTDETYVVRYLKCPDPDIKPLNLDQVVNIPKLLYSPKSSSSPSKIIERAPDAYPEQDISRIYEFSQTKVKYGDMLKTIDQLESDVRQYFPEFKGFNIVSNITEGKNQITIYYITDPDKGDDGQDESYGADDGSVNSMRVAAFKEMERSYFVTSEIKFKPAKSVDPFDIARKFMDINVTLHMKEALRYDIAESIIKGYQSKVGQPWNPFQLISDLMGNEIIGPFIRYVDISPSSLMAVQKLDPDKRVLFSADSTINYE